MFTSVKGYNQIDINKNLIKINPLGTIVSAIPLSYERMFLNNKFSGLINITVISSKTGIGSNIYNNTGYAISPELRHYFYSDSKLPYKFYTGFFVNYENHSNKTLDRLDNAVIGTAEGIGTGILFGNQWFLNNGFVFDFFVGPGYTAFTLNENYQANLDRSSIINSMFGSKKSGTIIRLGFSLGYSF